METLSTIKQQILAAYPKNAIVSQAIKVALDHKETPPLNMKQGQWKLYNGLLSKDEQLYIPDNTDIKRRIVALHYNTLAVGHPGYYNTLVAISRIYYWPNIGCFIANYI